MILTTRTVDVPALRELDDRTDEGDMRNTVRAEFGRAAVEVGTPDFGHNDQATDAADVIANILHWLNDFGPFDAADVLAHALDHYDAEMST